MQDRERLAEIVGVDIGAQHHWVIAETGYRNETDFALSERIDEQSATVKARHEVAVQVLAQLGAGTLDEGRAEADARPIRRVALVAQHRHPLLVNP